MELRTIKLTSHSTKSLKNSPIGVVVEDKKIESAVGSVITEEIVKSLLNLLPLYLNT